MCFFKLRRSFQDATQSHGSIPCLNDADALVPSSVSGLMSSVDGSDRVVIELVESFAVGATATQSLMV